MSEDKVEDVYALSPMQAGMLFHTLLDTEQTAYLDQQVLTLPGNLDTSLFGRAWHRLIERHAMLRTSFHWEGLEEPVQVVHAKAVLSLQHRDWSPLSAEEKQAALAALMKEDRALGMDLSQAPLMRLTLIRTGT